MSFDVIVVGSGFGGSVTAARLAQRGFRVLIVERGPWWGPLQRSRPANAHRAWPRGMLGSRKFVRNVRVAQRGQRWEKLLNADGLLETHRFDHLDVVTGSGVGGGSHLYTGILEAPDADFFDAFPSEITGDELAPYFERVRRVLRPTPAPRPSEHQLVFERAAAAAGLESVESPPIAVAWGQPGEPASITNAAGVEQKTFAGRGDVFVGCEDGSKTTLDLTYVPLALAHGAEIRPLAEVETVERQGKGYRVSYFDHKSGEVGHVSAPRLILAAGGLNTQRLLFAARSQGALPAVSSALGKRFSPNGDFATLLWNTERIRTSSKGSAFGALSRLGHERDRRFLVGDVGLPVAALPLPRALRAIAERSVLLFCMGRDPSNGCLGFDGVGLTSSLARGFARELFCDMEEVVDRIAKYYAPRRKWPHFPSIGSSEKLFSVHPLGGCAMASDASRGVTDHRGEVFGYPGLFVADGSLYPSSPGMAPSLTIAALAERTADLME